MKELHYLKYFRIDQKISLRSMAPPPPHGRVERLTVNLYAIGAGQFDLKLPYRLQPGEDYPFVPGMPFELLSDSFGLGIRLTGMFNEQINNDVIRLTVYPDLQVFQRRQHARVDMNIGLRYTRGSGKLRTFQSQWERNVLAIQRGQDLSKLGAFPRCQANLSAGGIGFHLKKPVRVADLCLLLMELEPQTPPICALAEIVWSFEITDAEWWRCGLQYINILEEDQKRLDKFVKDNGGVVSKPPPPKEPERPRPQTQTKKKK